MSGHMMGCNSMMTQKREWEWDWGGGIFEAGYLVYFALP